MGRDIACLPDSDHPKEGKVCWAAGWGRDENGEVPKTLQEVDLEIISDKTCKTTKNAPFIVEEMMFCAGYLKGEKDACQGDSGGPLICAENGKPVLRGVTSWGFGCGQANAPGVWTKVSSYTDWISSYL